MRNIVDVINSIKEISINEELNIRMDKIVSDAGFKAPEVMYQLWNRLQFELFEAYENPHKNAESLKIFSIFTGRSEEELIQIEKEMKEITNNSR